MTAPARAESQEARDLGVRERGKIAGRALIVGAGTLFSRVLGLVRDQVIAAVFARGITDAFFVAFTLPNVLRQVLGEGAVQSAVLPVLAATREREGDDAARRFFAAVRGLSLTLLTIVSVLGVVFAPQIVELFAAGLHGQPGQFERAVLYTRWVFPYIFLVGSAALGVAALNAFHRFTAAAFAPALLNVAFVAFSLTLPAWLGARGYDPGLALVLAVLVGGVLQVVAQWPSLARIGCMSRPDFRLIHPGLREVGRRMLPVAIGTGVYYVDVLLARRFLSGLGLGAQSYFSWALRLCDFPQGIFVMALQAAALPSLARFAAKGDLDELSKTFAFGMRLVLFVALPATLLSVALAEPLIILLFERGAFDRESAHQTARALVAQGAGIWAVAAVRQLLAVYYAVGDTKTPVKVASIDLLAFTAAALVLKGPLGHVGVSAAVSIASVVQMVLLWERLRLKVPELGARTREIIAASVKVTAAATAAAVLAAYSAGVASEHFEYRGAPGAVGALVGLLAFLGLALALRCEEAQILLRRVRRHS